MIRHIRSRALALLCMGALTASGVASATQQEGQKDDKTPPPIRITPGGETDSSEAAARNEMLELFAQVERRLRNIDDLLYDASAGEAGLDELEESGIGDLLQNSMQSGEQVLEDIDRILQIAQQQGGT